ncbi:MAG: hypothetical protein ABL927_15575, partial [Bdellovibrionales bacterium]
LMGAWVKTSGDPQAKIKATLNIKRSGVLVANSAIEFKVSATSVKRAVLNEDIAALSDSKNIKLTLMGKGASSALVLNDITEELIDVASSYAVILDLKNSDGTSKRIASQTLTREQLKNSNSLLAISALINNVQTAELALKAGNTIAYTVNILRTSANLNVPKAKSIKVSKTGVIKIK